MKQVKENNEIADVAFEIVGDVAEKAHSEMTFKKEIARRVHHHENFKNMQDVCSFLLENADCLVDDVVINPYRVNQFAVHCKMKCD